MRNATVPGEYIQYFAVPQLHRMTMLTTADLVEEIFSPLCYFTDVQAVGREQLTKRGVASNVLDDAFFAMQSFVRQAKAFYISAQHIGPRSSPLIYYYAFLNLAKALLCFTRPERVQGKILHGLTLDLKAEPLDKQSLTVVPGGVFELLYEAILGESLPAGVNFNVLQLLTYCTDISAEIEETKAASHSTYRVLTRALKTRDNRGYVWFAIPQFSKFEVCEPAKERFYKSFDEVVIDKDMAHTIFGVPTEFLTNFRFFETKEFVQMEPKGIDVGKLAEQCRSAIRPYILENPYFEPFESDFYLSRPLAANHLIPFNQIVAIYAGLYFLSSLVRYHPVYFEKQFASRDAWIIDAFVRSTPITLLRYLTNRFLNQNRQYRIR